MRRSRDPMTIDPRFGRRIRQLRLARNMTGLELATTVNVTKPMVYNWELGNYRPNAVMIQRLADALGVKPGELFDYSTLPDPAPADVAG